MQYLVIVGVDSDTEKPIIALDPTVLRLLRRDDPSDANFNQASDVGRCIHQNQDVERIAVFTDCRGYKALDRARQGFGCLLKIPLAPVFLERHISTLVT